MILCAVNVSLFAPHEPTLSSICVRSCVRPPPQPPQPFSQNQDQLKEPDTDFLNGDGSLTFTFGDTSITANGASGGGGGAGGGDGGANRTAWSANGKQNAITSEEALEPELDSREQELLSRGTRLVLTMEDQA